MKDFVYQMPVKVYFGENSVKRYLKDELKHYGKNIMLAYGQESIKRNGIYDEVIEVLGECEKNIIDFPGISANPTYEKALDGIRLYKENNVDLILAIGGGSVIDCCKVICSGTEINEDIWEVQLEKGLIPENMGNFAVILTLSGAGAEMDCLGAVTYEKRHEKKTLTGPYAKFVIEDPNYIMTVPLKVFMPGVFDSLTHCMETYFGKTTNVSDLLNEGLMKDIIYNMRELIHGNDSLEVRSNLMWDSSLVQTFLFNVGKPGDFQAHKIENALGAYSHGTHGQQLAVIQPAYYRAVYKGNVSKFARFSRVIMEIHDKDSEENVALKGIEALEKLIKEAQLSTTFTELGYELTEDIARTVSQTCEISKTGPRELTREEIYELLLHCK
ncbi:iron-containing alcohol dehydrogenase [Thomasclavelia ramosa]|uniref:iron-containing alcohol dehydrogenase n=1 Tax=Thomasclavelia ramosa TaxID=1547 RepID=UPI001C2C3DB8|nr:iron-containing alcohol dehydrogenase [Thomasclavelia ramosa]MBV4098101.1 iron-containing alcohol dehydrogenase [Thomasclavelia ramosa]MBV4119918.1 iron-containing alcohol dehydrogenase [Thomasclavelia ramosa]